MRGSRWPRGTDPRAPHLVRVEVRVRVRVRVRYVRASTAPCSAKVTTWNCSEGSSVQVDAAKERRLIANMTRTWPQRLMAG